MTRINIVSPTILSDKHLVAEWHEIGRIVTLAEKLVESGEVEPIPDTYRMGKGHMRFFVDKLCFILVRTLALELEMKERGYNPDPHIFGKINKRICDLPLYLFKPYYPTPEAFAINMDRLRERDPESYGG